MRGMFIPVVKPLPARALEGGHTARGGGGAEAEGATGAGTPATLSHWTPDI